MEGLGVAFFATGPGLGLIMYILMTLKFHTTGSPSNNFQDYCWYDNSEVSKWPKIII